MICREFFDNDITLNTGISSIEKKMMTRYETHFCYWKDKEPPLEKSIELFSDMFKGFSIFFIIDDMSLPLR